MNKKKNMNKVVHWSLEAHSLNINYNNFIGLSAFKCLPKQICMWDMEICISHTYVALSVLSSLSLSLSVCKHFASSNFYNLIRQSAYFYFGWLSIIRYVGGTHNQMPQVVRTGRVGGRRDWNRRNHINSVLSGLLTALCRDSDSNSNLKCDPLC